MGKGKDIAGLGLMLTGCGALVVLVVVLALLMPLVMIWGANLILEAMALAVIPITWKTYAGAFLVRMALSSGSVSGKSSCKCKS